MGKIFLWYTFQFYLKKKTVLITAKETLILYEPVIKKELLG